MPNAPRTRGRLIRVSDELWEAAQETARLNGETVSEVIRRALAKYANVEDLPRIHGRRDRQ